MIYTPLTKNAMKLSFELHQDQVDKGGLPYPFHPFYVANLMKDEASCCTALLHDVLEDTTLTKEDLLNQGFPASVVNAVDLLSKKENESYMDYIKNIQKNEIARVVKIADLKHNVDVSRLIEVNDLDLKRIERYHQAIEILENRV